MIFCNIDFWKISQRAQRDPNQKRNQIKMCQTFPSFLRSGSAGKRQGPLRRAMRYTVDVLGNFLCGNWEHHQDRRSLADV